MPSPERGSGQPPPEERRSRETEPAPYLRAARFPEERAAGRVYIQLQDALYTGAPNDLSVYRLQLHHQWHVAILGEPPPPPLERSITTALAAGEAVTLPADVVAALVQRRAQAIQRGPWVERHFRPGKPL